MVTDAGCNMLAALNEVGFKGIVCITHRLHLVVCDAIGLSSHVKPKWDAATQETQALLEQCHQLVKAANWLCVRQVVLGQETHVFLMDLPPTP